MRQGNVFRMHAEEARQQAEKATLPDRKAAWIKMAEEWERLACDAEENGR
jgi:hypothetical protein